MATEHIKPLKEFIFAELKQGDLEGETDKSLDGLIFNAPTTLRLNQFGFHLLNQVYTHEAFQLERSLTGRELLTLKNYVTWPYYLPGNHSNLYLFTIKQAFVLKLNGGDVKKWLENLYNKNSNKNKDL